MCVPTYSHEETFPRYYYGIDLIMVLTAYPTIDFDSPIFEPDSKPNMT